MPTAQGECLLTVLKRVAAVLRQEGLPFALGGGLAAWAHGGPATEHDIDFVIQEGDVEAALDALEACGFRTERPPEDWLVKVWEGPVLVDLIFRPIGLQIDQAFFSQCHERDVHAVTMRVLSVEDLMVTKLLALTEHHLDYGPPLEYARSLREQVDWSRLGERVHASPFARAFLCLVHELGIAPVPTARPQLADLNDVAQAR
jgi:hypothetical protein